MEQDENIFHIEFIKELFLQNLHTQRLQSRKTIQYKIVYTRPASTDTINVAKPANTKKVASTISVYRTYTLSNITNSLALDARSESCINESYLTMTKIILPAIMNITNEKDVNFRTVCSTTPLKIGMMMLAAASTMIRCAWWPDW